MSWESLTLNEDLSRGIYRFGFEKPTPIQEKAIPPIIEGRDIIAQGQSGTGKTGSFTIGASQRVDITSRTTQVLILATHIRARQADFDGCFRVRQRDEWFGSEDAGWRYVCIR